MLFNRSDVRDYVRGFPGVFVTYTASFFLARGFARLLISARRRGY